MLSRDDLQLTRRDRNVPALAELLDDDTAAEVIRQAVPHLDVRSVSGCYLRYKPGVSLLAAYLADTPAGTTHVHVTAYGRDGSDKLKKRRRSTPRVSNDGLSVVEPVVDAARSLIVWPFPADDAIAALPAFGTPGLANDLWQRLGLERHLGLAPTWQIARYKPQRRLVAVGLAGARPCTVLRLYGAASYGRARRAAKSLCQLTDHSLPSVASHSDRYAALLMKWQPGATLSELLKSADRGVIETACTQTGKMLARLHAQVAGKLPARNLGLEAAVLRQSAADLGQLSPDLRDVAAHVAGSCLEFLNTGSACPATLHGDLHLSQIVVDAKGARLIDLDQAAVGEAAMDLGSLNAHLHRDAEAIGSDLLPEDLWNALLAGYAEVAAPPPERRLAAWTAAAWLRLAHEPFRCRRADWLNETAATLKRASSSLPDLRKPSSSVTPPGRCGEPPLGSGDAYGRFSEDESLRFAAAALDQSEADARVSPLVRSFLGDDSWQLVSLRLARHKPARRFLVEYCYRNHCGDQAAVFGKVHVKRRHRRSLQLQQELLGSGFATDAADGIGVPASVGVVPEWQMWLQQRVEGVDGWQILTGPDAPRFARQVSDAVVKLQQSGLMPQRIHTIAHELDTLSKRYERLGRERPGWRRRLNSLLAGCRELATCLPTACLTPAHGDFYPDQLRGTGQRMWVLDHDLCCLADVHLDVGNFIGHLHELALRETRCRELFLGVGEKIVLRFLERQPAATRRGVEIYTTLTLARHVSLSTQFQARRHATEKILAECERRTAALGRDAALANLTH